MPVRIRRVAAALVALAAASGITAAQPEPATIVIDPAVRHQTFRGWETAVLGTVRDYYRTLPGMNEAFRLGASDLNLTRIALSLSPGMERPAGPGLDYIEGRLTERAYIDEYIYRAVNDNGNPKVADPAGFDFANLDWQMTYMVMPFVEAVKAAGLTPVIVARYVDFGKVGFGHYDHPDEYAELFSVLFAHMKAKYGVVPDEIDVINEPDNMGRWTGEYIGRALLATGRRLEAEGYRPRFVAPSTMDRAKALPFLAEVLRTKGVERYLSQVTYHCYADSGKNSHAAIGQVVSKTNLESGQNECWGESNNIEALAVDLTQANVSTWQLATINGVNGFYEVDPVKKTATLRPKVRLLRQFFHYVPPGSVRIGATGTGPTLTPVAFIAPGGRYVVVVVARAGGPMRVSGLPQGTYDVSYSTPNAFDVHTSVTVGPDGVLATSIPGAGALTINGAPSGRSAR
ncbi:MAG: glycoside hydrolase family 30 beta sandwich domain-containing protein [Vicinamibacterales bacterium]